MKVSGTFIANGLETDPGFFFIGRVTLEEQGF